MRCKPHYFCICLLIGFTWFILSAMLINKVILIPFRYNKCLHVHHYMLLFPLAFIILAYVYTHNQRKHDWALLYIVAFCIGGGLTNFLYNDWNCFIRPCNRNTKMCQNPLRNTVFNQIGVFLCKHRV